MSKRKPFPLIHLEIPSDSEEDQIKARKVFDALKKAATGNQFMTEREKEFFCRCVKNSLLNDGDVNDYPNCDNFTFKELYLTYWHDIFGTGHYTKLYGYEEKVVPIIERVSDLEKLKSIATSWEVVISQTNHSEKLLQSVSKEARDVIKALNDKPEFNVEINPFIKGSNFYKYKKWSLLLFSKYIYLMAKEIFEYTNESHFRFNLCGVTIEMDELSIVHILQRHYGEGVKKFQTGKSHFYGEFEPQELNTKFRYILGKIDQSDILSPNDIFKFPFSYKGINYMIWISEKYKQIKGHKENLKFLHLSSFHPITDVGLLTDLKNNYILTPIDSEISVYQKVL